MQYVLECTEADLDRSLSEPEKMADIVIPMLIAALFKKKVFEASLRSTESRRNRKTIRHAWRTTHSGPRSTLPRIGDQAIPQRVAPQHCPPPLHPAHPIVSRMLGTGQLRTSEPSLGKPSMRDRSPRSNDLSRSDHLFWAQSQTRRRDSHADAATWWWWWRSSGFAMVPAIFLARSRGSHASVTLTSVG